MKKVLIIILTCFILTGCISNRRINNNVFKTSNGTYMIPSNWEKNRNHSTVNKYFFTNKKDRKNNLPNNISVEEGTNKYSKEDHIMFRQAIVRQLTAQLKMYGTDLKGNGWTSKNGYNVYTFVMKGKDSTTIQHYIVGHYKYILVHETIFTEDEKDSNDAAKYMINSFKWKE